MIIGYSEDVRSVDRLTVEKYGADSLMLMKNAATAVYKTIMRQDVSDKHICILCGKGNNAGDGFALASMLSAVAGQVSVVLLCGKEFSQDAGVFFERLSENINIISDDFVCADIYVDAVFGTGFCGVLPERIALFFEKINTMAVRRIAIDIPSGVNADSGECSLHTFAADTTVTFEILKLAHVLPISRDYCGKIIVEDIGLSKGAIEEVGFHIELLDDFTLPHKSSVLHKGNNGTLFSIVGCKQYQGAATLSTKAALRGGCGIVAVFVPESIYLPLACKVDGAVILSCPENERGMHSSKSVLKFAKEAQNRSPSAILAGCGMGVQTSTAEIIGFVLQQEIDCIIDGDGLRYVSPSDLQQRNNSTILTPHLGEFARMIGLDVPSVAAARFSLSRKYAMENNCVLVLKDSITIISAPNGRQWVLSSPNPGMAKGGSGDVLAGMIASFMAQGFSAIDAARAGVLYHSAAGKSARDRLGEYAMLPEDVIFELSNVLRI